MKIRTIMAVITSLLDEAAIVVVIVWVLPNLGIKIPLWGTILCVLGFAIFAVVSFRIGTRTLRQPPLPGFTSMIGMEGVAADNLNPEGYVRVEGTLWSARSENAPLEKGAKIVVASQNGLQLIVRRRENPDF